MIEVSNLTKRYGPLAAVDDISFSVGQGEIIGFLGPNGAGKTTTMRMLTGFSPPTSGTAVVAGHDIAASPVEVKRRVGYLPESVPLYTDMVVRSFLDYVATVKGVPRKERRSEIARVIERSGLSEMGNRLIRNLSRGYRQRVGLAQALVGNPPVLILDEPTVGLDPNQIVEIRQMIKELSDDHTVLLSTHILPEVAMICERVLIINRGRIVAQDRMSDLAQTDVHRLEVEVEQDGDWIEDAVKKIPGVTMVSRLRDRCYRVDAEGAGTAASLSKHLIEGGAGVCRLEEKRRTLEEVFVEATTKSSDAVA